MQVQCFLKQAMFTLMAQLADADPAATRVAATRVFRIRNQVKSLILWVRFLVGDWF